MSYRLRRLLAASLVPLAVLSVTGVGVARAQSADQDEYNRLLSRLGRTKQLVADAERKERALKKDIARTGAERDALADDVEELRAQLADAQSRVDAAEQAKAVIDRQLAQKTEEMNAALQELQETFDLLRSRASRMYKSGPASLFDFVLGALSFRDLIGRVMFVERVFRSDDVRIARIETTKQRITSERAEIEALRGEAAAQVEIAERERNRVAAIKGKLDSQRSALDGRLKQQYATLEDVEQDKDEYLRQQRELERESSRIAAFLRGRSGGKASVGAGGMVWPTQGTVTSGYGWRTHPIFGTRKFHAGIDIGAPAGQTVVAAASGEVIYAGEKGGYGNTVMIDHGGGLATLYAHLSSFGVGVGAKVAQGRSIARVGCTGYCTGPHLHFEVRVNGEPQDPMRWLG